MAEHDRSLLALEIAIVSVIDKDAIVAILEIRFPVESVTQPSLFDVGAAFYTVD